MRRFWTEQLDNLLRRHYPKGDLYALAARIGVSRAAVKGRANRLGIRRKVNEKKPWTERQLRFLRRHYADSTNEELTRGTGHTVDCIYKKAASMGLKKSREYLHEQRHTNGQHPNFVACRFKKGHVPANKGKREHEFRSAEAIAKCRLTQFKAGQLPHNNRPVGYESIHGGYVFVKVEGERKMVMKHRYVWQQANGPVPDGYCVCFRDGNHLNCSLDNLELVSRKDTARRNISRETPEQRSSRIAKTTAKRNESIRKDRLRIHWGLEPRTKLVKRW